MKKTINQWIEDAIALTPSEKEKIRKYVTQYQMPNGVQRRFLDSTAISFQDALMGSFVFSETEEGFDYWYNVCLLEEKAMNSLYEFSAE